MISLLTPILTSPDGMSFFANVNQTAANDDDADQPPPSGTETPQAVSEPAPAAKPKPPRKRKPEMDENGEPIQKRKRRTKAEMYVYDRLIFALSAVTDAGTFAGRNSAQQKPSGSASERRSGWRKRPRKPESDHAVQFRRCCSVLYPHFMQSIVAFITSYGILGQTRAASLSRE